MKKTLVIHPSDDSTDFLGRIYLEKGWTVIRDHKATNRSYSASGRGITRQQTVNLINEHDKIIMMGHGFPNGLFMTHIDSSMADVLREKECVYIWCNADQYVKQHDLTGFYTGMFISEVSEAGWFGIETTQEEVDTSNHLFADVVAENIDKENFHLLITESYDGESEVIQYNHHRLYYRGITRSLGTKGELL